MKRFIAILALVCFSTTMIFAQDAKPAAKGQTKKPATEVKAAKADANKANADANKAKAEAKKEANKAKDTGSAVGPTKKDGTPDMRYKANKEAAKPAAGPTKKDGTPDMRYKANKKAAEKAK